MPPSAVIFDLFGTLVPNLHPDQFESLMVELSGVLNVSATAFAQLWREDFRLRMDGRRQDGPGMFAELLTRMGCLATAEQLERADAVRSDFMMRALEPKADAIACLEALESAGYRLGLCTDCSSSTPQLLDRTSLGALLPVRAASALLRTTKPDPVMYAYVTERLQVRADECIYVGDGNSEELLGARRLGMTTIWVDNGARQFWTDRFDSDSDHRVTRLEQIPGLLSVDR